MTWVRQTGIRCQESPGSEERTARFDRWQYDAQLLGWFLSGGVCHPADSKESGGHRRGYGRPPLEANGRTEKEFSSLNLEFIDVSRASKSDRVKQDSLLGLLFVARATNLSPAIRKGVRSDLGFRQTCRRTNHNPAAVIHPGPIGFI